MFCRQVQSHLDDYILNQISKELSDEIDNHLKKCLDCQKQLDNNRQIITALKSIATPDPGDFYWQQLENSVLARTVDRKSRDINLPRQAKIGPISIMQKYLIPLAASFLILFGSIFYADSDQQPIRFGSQTSDRSSLFMAARNNPAGSHSSDSQTFTAIVSGAPGSLGLHLVFANITGTASLNGINGGSR